MPLFEGIVRVVGFRVGAAALRLCLQGPMAWGSGVEVLQPGVQGTACS